MQDSSDDRLRRAMAAVRDEQTLRGRLEQIVRRKGLCRASVGVLVEGRELAVSAGTAGDEDTAVGSGAAGGLQVAAGCLAKSLTAALVHDAIAEGRIGWTDGIAELLASDPDSRQRLDGITVRHLLDHTHGLDGSALSGVPRTHEGFVDVARLCQQLDPQPLFSPGRMYSYGHVGAWLAGALLERIAGVPYATQLRGRRLLDDAAGADAGVACPATGAGLTLTVTQWLAFARQCLPQLEDGTHDVMALPGWHPVERSICRGWKCYGEGWFGHNANLSDRSAILRLHPQEQLAIVVSANDTNGAVFAASGVFGDLLPEFRNLRPPRLLRTDEAAALPVRDHVGRYGQVRTVVEVTLDDQGALHLGVAPRNQDVAATSRLRAADRGVFLAESRGNPEFQFVQFIADEASPGTAYLWNGRQIWRREPDPR